MDLSQKISAIGIGFIVAGLLIAIGIVRKIFPDQNRAKRMWFVVLPSVLIGMILLIVGVAV